MADEKNSTNSYKRISNPLTIIGLFAGIAEVAGTVVLPLINEGLQKFFIFYVMGFPVLLVILFFRTLNKNPKVLYAPSDFSDESNFMQLLLKEADEKVKEISVKNPAISEQLKPVQNLINSATDVANVTKRPHVVGDLEIPLSEDAFGIAEYIMSTRSRFTIKDIVEFTGLEYDIVANCIIMFCKLSIVRQHSDNDSFSLSGNIELNKYKRTISKKRFLY